MSFYTQLLENDLCIWGGVDLSNPFPAFNATHALVDLHCDETTLGSPLSSPG